MAKSRRQRKKRSLPEPSAAPRPGSGPGAGPRQPLRWSPHWSPQTLALAALALLVAVSYWPVISFDYIWDDKIFLEAAPVMEWAGLADIWFNPRRIKLEAHYWPILFSSFWLEHKLWGFSSLGSHLINVFLHGTIVVLLWRLLTRLKVPGAWLIAALFAVHPIHVEPVAWAIGRKDLLATLFYLLAAGCWLRFREEQNPGAYIAMLTLFVAGMLSKSMAITFPAALLVWVWWQQGRIVQRDLLHVAPLFLLGIGITIGDLTFYTARAIIDFDYPYIERPVIAAKALWFYVAKLLWPYPLMAIYPKWDINPANWLNWLPMLAGMVLLSALWLARQRIGRGPLAAVLFFAVIVSPMLGLGLNVFMQFSFAADRYQYLASAGLLALVVALAVVACRRLPSQVMHGAKALAALLIVACVALTWQQVQLFKNDVTFWNHVVATNPAAHSAYYNQGLALVDAGRPEDGIAAYMQALERDPDSAGTYINLSFALLEVDRLEESEQAARRATELDPKALLAHQNLASALHKLERYEETLAALKNVAALMKRPTAEHNFHMGHIAGLLDRTQEAERHLRRALSIGPEHQEALNELVHLYLKAGRYADAQKANPRLHDTLKAAAYHHYSEGRYDQALQNYQHSLGIDPDDAQMHVNQGYALEQLQRMEEAEQSYKRALAIEPNMQTALSQLAALYFNGRRYEDALNLYRRNVELEPDSAEAHSNLGSALAQSGRLQEAIESFQRALELNPQLASARTNLDKAREMLGSQ